MGFFIFKTVKRFTKRLEAAELNFLSSNPLDLFTPGYYPRSFFASLEIFDSTVTFDYSGQQFFLAQQNSLMICDVSASFPTGNYIYQFVMPGAGYFPTNVGALSPISLSASGDSASVGDGYGILTYFYS